MNYYISQCRNCKHKWIQKSIQGIQKCQCPVCYSKNKKIKLLSEKEIHGLLNRGLKKCQE
jgi:Zn finger protein HypA/HybF involved in hydrogenase expression